MSVPVPNQQHMETVCRKQPMPCKFLSFHPHLGFACEKNGASHAALVRNAATGQMRSRGDNCSGPPDFQPITEEVPPCTETYTT